MVTSRSLSLTAKTTVPTPCTPPFHRRTPSNGFPAYNALLNPERFMTTSPNRQTAAEQARAAYRRMTDQLGHLGLDTAVPEGVRALADKSVTQTRQAYDRSLDAFDASLTTFERSFDAAGQGAAAFNRKIVDIARRNVDARLRLSHDPGGRQDPRRHRRGAIGLLAQAVRRNDGASRRSPCAVGEGDEPMRPSRSSRKWRVARTGWSKHIKVVLAHAAMSFPLVFEVGPLR